MRFADVSYVQGLIDWTQYPFDIVAIKVTEGTTIVDPYFKQNRAGALARGVREIWYYHFARPEYNNPAGEASFFHGTLGTIRPQDRVMLDLEIEGGNPSDYALKWNVPYLRRVLYSDESYFNRYLNTSQVASVFPEIWIAAYGPTPPPCPSCWESTGYLAWQYTDVGRLPGISGNVDLSYYAGESPMLFTEQSRDFQSYFTASSATLWTCKQTGKTIQAGNLAAYKQMSVDGESLPLPGLPVNSEQYITLTDGTKISVQFLERAILVYDPAHKIDRQPGLGDSYLLKYEQAYQIPEIATLIPGLPTSTKIPDIVLNDIRQLVKDAGI